MLFDRIRYSVKKIGFHIEHGTVIGHIKKKRLVVTFDNGETKLIKDKSERMLDIGASGYFVYKINRLLGFERDLDL